MGQAKKYFAPALAAMVARDEKIQNIDQIKIIIDLVRNESLLAISESEEIKTDDKKKLLKDVSDIDVLYDYPSEYYNDTILEDLYKSADVVDGNYYESVLKLEHFLSQNYGQRILKTVEETQWSSYLDENFEKSTYSDSKSFIFIHPAELQYPYFDKHLPDYVNFGGLGSRVGILYGIAINYKVSASK